MIFLSHNYKDKEIVEPIAIRLSEVFGQEHVFYDSWSIQPGDSIIRNMNEGLNTCEYFFFFISKNSLSSKMVELEWQSAIIKAAKGDIKFIPVRLDGSMIPPILLQSCYINLYDNGIEIAIRQIVDVVSGKNIYTKQFEQYSNLIAYKYAENSKIIVECHAKHYLEPISNYLFLIENNENELNFICKSSSISHSNFINNLKIGNIISNAKLITQDKPTVPDFPFVVEIHPISDSVQIKLNYILHEYSNGKWNTIPLINSKKL